MGILLLSSKRASVTLVFLIVSILVVSTGVVVVHEVKKTNNEVTGTGLVLLDEIQEIEDDLVNDNSNSFVVYDEDSSKDSSKSKKSGKSSGDDLELLSSDSENESLEEDFTNMSSQIFSRNGTDYILRDDKEYILSSSDSKSGEISFNPALPSSVCVGDSGNEKIDIKLDLGTVNLRWGYFNSDRLQCLSDGRRTFSIYYCLMEHDLIGKDDEIICGDGFATTYDCETLNLEAYYLVGEVKREFLDVYLGPQFSDLGDGNTIEVYATVFQNPAYDYNIFYSISTDSYKIDKEPDCDCISGSCCDLRSRPYEYRPYSYSCGKCKACNSVGSCSVPPSDDSACGIIDCSSWYVKSGMQNSTTNQWCYNKKDITSSRCEGFGNCKDSNTADCNSQSDDQLKYSCGICKFISTGDCTGTTKGSCSNYAKHVSCGTNKECDGSGSCIYCTSHAYTKCYNNDVYYYDSCDKREEKKLPDCGSDSCGDWLNFCKNDDVWKTRSCHDRGCSNGACFDNQNWEEEKVQDCQYGCEDEKCKENPRECEEDNDCPSDGYMGNAFCSGGHVYHLYRDYFCAKNPTTSYCTYTDTNEKIKDCGTTGCSDGVCNQEIDTYCSAYATNEDPAYGEWINNIKLNTGEKDSGSSNYSDFTSTLFTSLNKGNIYTLAVRVYTPDFYKEYVKAWIDFNNDKIFSTNEEIDLGNAEFNGDNIFEKSFIVPNNAISGETRMRVYLKYNSVPSPCENAEWGEVEDYKIKIIEGIICSSNSDCDTDAWVGSIFCLGDDIYQKWRTWTCNNPGTQDASCSYTDTDKKKEECGTDCYVGNAFCKNNNVWQTWRTYTCTSSATQGVFCSYSDQDKKKEDCGSFSCGSWGEDYCKGEDVYKKRSCYNRGCSSGDCFGNSYVEEQKVQDCENGCTVDRCLIEVCSWTYCWWK